MKTTILPFSGDPITCGHIDIIRRSLEIFNHVVVAIGTNIDKVGKYLFSQEEREFLAKKVLSQFGTGVSVKSFSGLLTDFAYKNNIKTIIRGSRGILDSAFEQMVNDVNRASNQGIETILMFSSPKLSYISSSTAKDIQRNFGQNILDYVPMIVKQALEEKLNNQFRIGVTGEIGAGKSTVTDELQKLHTASNIDLDQIGREILTKASDPVYISMRQELSRRITGSYDPVTYLLNPDGFIDVKTLSNKIFSHGLSRDIFNELTRDPMYLMLREKISALHGLIYINSALLAEADVLEFVNNNVILVRADKKIRRERLKSRGYSATEIDNRMHAQLDADEKLKIIEKSIQKHGHGKVVVFENNDKIKESDIQGILDKFKPSVFSPDEKL